MVVEVVMGEVEEEGPAAAAVGCEYGRSISPISAAVAPVAVVTVVAI